MEDYLKDLPYLLDRSVPPQEYETVPPQHEPGLDGELLPTYELSPERIRRRTPEEIEELCEKRERERAERYLWVYGLLGLRVVAHKDGTLELTWRAGSKLLGLGEPGTAERRSSYDGAATVLSSPSDSHR